MTKAILELARSISPATIKACEKRDIAAENEAKYGGGDEPEDRFSIPNRYREIAAGFDNGRCTTRAGTYRRFKTGSGKR